MLTGYWKRLTHFFYKKCIRTKNIKTQQIKNVLNVLFIWLWFQKRYSTRLLLNLIHMNYICWRKKTFIIDTDLYESIMFSFWKGNHIFFLNAKCVEQQTRAVDQTCTCTWINGDSIDLWLWNTCSLPGLNLLPGFSFDNWIIIGKLQNQNNKKNLHTVTVFIVVISVICENIKNTGIPTFQIRDHT